VEGTIPLLVLSDVAVEETLEGFEIRPLAEAFNQPINPGVHAAHRHDFFEIFLVESGRAEISVDMVPLAFDAPAALFLAPGRVHAWNVTRCSMDGFLLRFHWDFLAQGDSDPESSRVTTNLDKTLLMSMTPESFERTRHLLVAISRESREREEGWVRVIRRSLQIFLIELERLRVHPNKPPQVESDAALQLTRSFSSLVEIRYTRHLAVTDYAHELGVSESYLKRCLKRVTGKTAGQLHRQRLLLEAGRLLHYSPLTVSEIADRLGFGDLSYFTRFFRQQMGLSPTEFRMSQKVSR
jgi:AraC-like DNA-binding protein